MTRRMATAPSTVTGPEAPVKKKKKEKDWIFNNFV